MPDYVASAGGVIYGLAVELHHETAGSATARVQAIEDTVGRLLEDAARAGTTPAQAALDLATRRLAGASG